MTTKKKEEAKKEEAQTAQTADAKISKRERDDLAKNAVVDNATHETVNNAASGAVQTDADKNQSHDARIAGAHPGGEAIGNTNPSVTTGDGSTDLEGNSVMDPDLPDDSSAKTHGIGG